MKTKVFIGLSLIMAAIELFTIFYLMFAMKKYKIKEKKRKDVDRKTKQL